MTAATLSTTELATRLRARIESQHLALLSDVAADLHAHPEIRFTEVHAAERLTGELEAAGFEVTRGFADLETAFIGRWSTTTADNAAPTVGIFLEYDALEGIGHACGHNVIAASGLGAALLVKDTLTDSDVPAHIKVIGSPGEEGAAGKVPMIEGGVLEDVDFAIMIHPGAETLTAMPSLSRVALDVDFMGRAAHAAAAPEEGINALDAANLSLHAIGLLRQQLVDDVRIHAIVTDGGQAPNIIPEHTSIRCFVRAADNDNLLQNVVPRVENCFRGAALATGCEVNIAQNTPAYLSVRTNPILGGLADEAFAGIGRPVVEPTMGSGSTDMGNVSQVVPAIHPMIDLTRGRANPHTREFAAAANGPDAVPTIADGATVLATTAVQVLSSPELLAEVKATFEK